MHRILALDIGEKRIGIALSDALNITAQGIGVIEQTSDIKTTLDQIEALVKKHDVSKIIVGMPFNMNGTKGPSAKKIEAFSDALKKALGVQIEFIDERLSSKQGEKLLIEANVSRKKRKLSIDKIASQLILQTYLDSNV